MGMELIDHINIKNCTDQLVISWEWKTGGDANVDIYAKSWNKRADDSYGILLHRERKKESYAISSAAISLNLIANGIYDLFFVPSVGGVKGNIVIKKNVALGKKRTVQYNISRKQRDMLVIRFSFSGVPLPGDHFQVICENGKVFPFLTDIADQDGFLMYGVDRAQVRVEIAPEYRGCYILEEAQV